MRREGRRRVPATTGDINGIWLVEPERAKNTSLSLNVDSEDKDRLARGSASTLGWSRAMPDGTLSSPGLFDPHRLARGSASHLGWSGTVPHGTRCSPGFVDPRTTVALVHLLRVRGRRVDRTRATARRARRTRALLWVTARRPRARCSVAGGVSGFLARILAATSITTKVRK